MKYPAIRYVTYSQDLVLQLHSFDGTYRKVVFTSPEAMDMALRPGRAALDCSTVVNGLLPRGASSVSPALAADAKAIIDETKTDTASERSDPMAVVRLRFSQKLLVERSTAITRDTDAVIRRDHPERALIYDALIDDLTQG